MLLGSSPYKRLPGLGNSFPRLMPGLEKAGRTGDGCMGYGLNSCVAPTLRTISNSRNSLKMSTAKNEHCIQPVLVSSEFLFCFFTPT